MLVAKWNSIEIEMVVLFGKGSNTPIAAHECEQMHRLVTSI